MASKTNIRLRFALQTWIIIEYVMKLHLMPLNRETKLSLGYHIDSLLNFTELSTKYGYRAQEHNVVTEDGYILSVFRVESKNCKEDIKKTPVLLMHGLIESADVFLDAGPKSGLGYLIPDACFDLWVGNQRGNYYGRRHVHLNPDKDTKFWQFSAEEMGYYDLPAMYDYILNCTDSNKLNYIGYSQGGANFFIMCSERNEYCKKTNLMIGLAPAAILSNIESTTFVLLSQAVLITRPILEYFGVHEIFHKGSIFQEILEFLCQYTNTFVTDALCGTGGAFFDNYHPGSINYGTQRTLYGHFPAGSSVHNFARYAQIIRSGRFQKYDYGEAANLKEYGSKEPPEINISAVTIPVVIIHGKNDKLTAWKDVKSVERLLPNLIETITVADPLWNHFDIVYNHNSHNVIFPTVKKYLNKYSEV